MRVKYPTISILIPTLNVARVLGRCLESIVRQDYPKEKIEIIIADGGSRDNTLDIVKKFEIRNSKLEIRLVDNPLKTGEAGKAVALRQAKNELVALIDSDNLLPNKSWLKKMVAPFTDPEIIGSEPWAFTYRKRDGFIDRYCALMGMNDPLCYFLGNYDRLNVLSGRWTGIKKVQSSKFKVQNGKIKKVKRGDWDYLKVELKPPNLPTIGANGTILRRAVLLDSGLVGDYLFDIDVIAQLACKKPVKFAKVKVGIVHLYCGSDLGKFVRKQKRRIRDYLYYQKIGARHYPWQQQNKLGLVKFIFACLSLIPLFYQSLKGYLKKPDLAWFFHPLACWLTLWVYGTQMILSKFKTVAMTRKGWGQ